MSEKELVFVCSEIGTRDYEPKELIDKKFSDVSDWLWEKYDKQILNFLKPNFSGLESIDSIEHKNRAPLRFDYIDQAGKLVPIDHAEDVWNTSQITDQVYWHPQVIGGQRHFQIFGKHANEIITNPRYRNWKSIKAGQPGDGIWATGPDPEGIVHKWKIIPSADYPITPPIVIAEPSYKNDICWQSGKLNYTSYRGRGGSPWTELAQKSTNPLFALMIELLRKYKLGV